MSYHELSTPFISHIRCYQLMIYSLMFSHQARLRRADPLTRTFIGFGQCSDSTADSANAAAGDWTGPFFFVHLADLALLDSDEAIAGGGKGLVGFIKFLVSLFIPIHMHPSPPLSFPLTPCISLFLSQTYIYPILSLTVPRSHKLSIIADSPRRCNIPYQPNASAASLCSNLRPSRSLGCERRKTGGNEQRADGRQRERWKRV